MTELADIQRIWSQHRRQYRKDVAARWLTTGLVWGFVLACAWEFGREAGLWR